MARFGTDPRQKRRWNSNNACDEPRLFSGVGSRALTCLSLLRFRKRKKPNYFDDYSGFADSQALSVQGG